MEFSVNVDKHASSSSPPLQSFFPSQASTSGMNFTELEQKKYLESMSCLTGRKRSDKMHEQIRRLFDIFVHDSLT